MLDCSHCPPSPIGSTPCRLLPDESASDPRLVTQRRWATDLCEELLQLDTARVAAYNSASPVESEMTPCVAELVSSTESPPLITTQELLLRSVSFAAQSQPAYTSWYSSLALAGDDHARCGLCTKYRTTRRARVSVPHVARVISLMRFLTRCCTSTQSPDIRTHEQDCATKISAHR